LVLRIRRVWSAEENDYFKNCGCTTSQAAADALILGFKDEYEADAYSCCQVVAWADEQWLAWSEAAMEDGKSVQEATKALASWSVRELI